MIFNIHDILPFIPTSKKSIRAIIDSDILNGKKMIVDLGSGTGTMLAVIRKKYPNATLIGVEKKLFLVLCSRIRFLFSGKNKPLFICGDLFDYSVTKADAIVGFWITSMMPQLLRKFETECKKGSVITSNWFALPESPQFTQQNVVVGNRKIWMYVKQ